MEHIHKAAVHQGCIFRYKALTSIFPGIVMFCLTSISIAIECPDILPADSRSLGDMKLCEYEQEGRKDIYACQDVVSKERVYRVLFRGGQTPVAILQADIHDDPDRVTWSEHRIEKNQVCTLPGRGQVPSSAKFMGAGICESDDGQSVPCSVYRDKASRKQNMSDYLVFYDAHGKGPESASVIYFGSNHDAVPAELAYQIGIELISSFCCKQRGFAYLRYAYQLFPESVLYSTAYFRSIEEIITRKTDRVASFRVD